MRGDCSKLFYSRSEGKLQEVRMKHPNVALRRKTVQEVMDAFDQDPAEGQSRRDQLREVGQRVGEEFVHSFIEADMHGGSTGKQLLERVLEYDSSSGMGKFDLVSFSESPPIAKISVRNAFTRGADAEAPPSPFLVGYLGGVCRAVFGATLVAEFDRLPEGPRAFTISYESPKVASPSGIDP